jgi:UDP-GlcNAc:undecaprenyl-phosphate GlcNAc-1-phosphate transferase
MMNPGPFWDFVLTFTVVLILMPGLIHFASGLGLIDRPDERKQHGRNVPIVGGVAIFLAFLMVLGVRHFGEAGIREILAAGLLLVAMGVVDDRDGLAPQPRFLVQVIASCLMIFSAGILLLDFGALLGNWTLNLGWFAIPVTVFCVVGVTNATNMIDGMDGLSAGIMLVALSGLCFSLWGNGVSLAADPVIPALMGGLCAYLLFNLRLPWRKSAWAFLGDSGTLFLGFVLAWLLVKHSQGPGRLIAPVTALWLFAVPLLDTVFLMIKRKIAGKSMVGADKEHLHHAFLRAGWGVNATLGMIVFSSVGFAALGLLLERNGFAEYVSFVMFLGVSGLYYLGMSRVWRRMSLFGRRIE